MKYKGGSAHNGKEFNNSLWKLSWSVSNLCVRENEQYIELKFDLHRIVDFRELIHLEIFSVRRNQTVDQTAAVRWPGEQDQLPGSVCRQKNLETSVHPPIS